MRIIGITLEEEVKYIHRLFNRLKKGGKTRNYSISKRREYAILLLARLCVIRGMIKEQAIRDASNNS